MTLNPFRWYVEQKRRIELLENQVNHLSHMLTAIARTQDISPQLMAMQMDNTQGNIEYMLHVQQLRGVIQ